MQSGTAGDQPVQPDLLLFSHGGASGFLGGTSDFIGGASGELGKIGVSVQR